MKTSLYNNDGTLSAQAQSLLSPKPDDMSMAEWRKKLKEFRSLLSENSVKEFDVLRLKARRKAYYHVNEKAIKEKAIIQSKEYQRANKEKIRIKEKNYYQANKEKIKARCRSYHHANKEKINARSRAYREASKEQRKVYSQTYYKANKERIKSNTLAYQKANKEKAKTWRKAFYKANKEKLRFQEKAYRKANPDKLKELRKSPRNKLRNAVRAAFKRIGKNKPTNTLKLLGCSWEEAKAHIESLWQEGMSWDNHGRYGWHIDHIRPVSSFEEHELDQMNHITNLQPLWWQDNLSKSDKW